AEDDEIHALGMLYRRRRAFVVLHGANAGVEIENLAKGHVEGADAAANGRGERSFDGNAEVADGSYGFVRQPVIEFGFGFFSGENFIPGDAALALVGLFDGRIKHANRSLPDVAPSAVALNERDDRVVGDLVAPIRIRNSRAIRRHRNTVVRSRHSNPPCQWEKCSMSKLIIIKGTEGLE